MLEASFLLLLLIVIQGHFGGEAINIGRVTDIIEELSQFNLPIWVTEFDWAGDNVRHIYLSCTHSHST